MDHPIIIFDGVCHLCTTSVQFIIKRDRSARFRFAAAQSVVGRELQKRYAIDAIAEGSIVLLLDGQVYKKSAAAIEIAQQLDGIWRGLSAFRFLPIRLRDAVYTYIANHRYRWFGQQDQCLVPNPDLRNRFLTEVEEIVLRAPKQTRD